MEYLILLAVIFFIWYWLSEPSNTPKPPTETKNSSFPTPPNGKKQDTTTENSPNHKKPLTRKTKTPASKKRIKLTDDEIRQRFEEKYKNYDFPASDVTVVHNQISHCPKDGTVLFYANVIYNMGWYKHIKCCPQCSTTYIEELQSRLVDFRGNQTILWVCKYQQSCNQRKHVTTSAKGILFKGHTVPFEPVEINIQYCYACKEYFISEAQFKLYKKKHPLLLGNFMFTDSLETRKFSGGIQNKESKLHLNGYNVNINNKSSDIDRRRILAYVIEKDILDKSYVAYYLSMFIERSKTRKNFKTAISKWENDLDWVNKYNFDSQRPVWIDDIRHK